MLSKALWRDGVRAVVLLAGLESSARAQVVLPPLGTLDSTSTRTNGYEIVRIPTFEDRSQSYRTIEDPQGVDFNLNIRGTGVWDLSAVQVKRLADQVVSHGVPPRFSQVVGDREFTLSSSIFSTGQFS